MVIIKQKFIKMVRTYHQMPTYGMLHLSEGTWGARVDNF